MEADRPDNPAHRSTAHLLPADALNSHSEEKLYEHAQTNKVTAPCHIAPRLPTWKNINMCCDDAVELPIDGVLDLHTFNPKDVNILVPEYLNECRRRGILDVRIIHGKGTGILRARVHSILKKLPEVLSFQTAGSAGGEWGATEVILKALK